MNLENTDLTEVNRDCRVEEMCSKGIQNCNEQVEYAKYSEQIMQDSCMTATERTKPASQGLSEVYVLKLKM